MDNAQRMRTGPAGASPCFSDVITIQAPLARVHAILNDLTRHSTWVPDGFKLYQLQTRAGQGDGARAALQLNLLGHWMAGEVSIGPVAEEALSWVLLLEYVGLRADFTLSGRESRTEVRLSVTCWHRELPFWRVRSRIKRHLRLERDAVTLFERCLSSLKHEAERQGAARAGTEEAGQAGDSSARPQAHPTGPSPASAGGAVQTSGRSESASIRSALDGLGAEKNTAEKNTAEKQSVELHTGAGSSIERTAADKTTADKTAAEKTAAEKSASDGLVPEKPAAAKPMAASASFRRPVILPSSQETSTEKRSVVAGAVKPASERVEPPAPAAPASASAPATAGGTQGGAPSAASSGASSAPSSSPLPAAPATPSQSASMVNGFQAVFKAAELPIGQGRSVVVQGRKIAVYHVEEGFFALADQCPHRQNPLATGALNGCEVSCAAHGWTFDITNGTSTNVLGAGVLRFEVSVRDGTVWINPRPLRPVFPPG